MIVEFTWGAGEGSDEWGLEQIPRIGEYVHLERYAGFVKAVTWELDVDRTPQQVVRVKLS